MSATDQRMYERFSARFPVKIKDSRGDYGVNLFLRDASADGMKLTSKERFFLNDNLCLEVKLPDSADPLKINGQVVWSKTREQNALWDVGVKFHKISFMTIRRLFQHTHSQ